MRQRMPCQELLPLRIRTFPIAWELGKGYLHCPNNWGILIQGVAQEGEELEIARIALQALKTHFQARDEGILAP